MRKKVFSRITITIIYLLILSCKKGKLAAQAATPQTPSATMAVPLAGNGYITQSAPGATEAISDTGLNNWNNANTITSVYFRLGKAGQLHVAIKAKVPTGNSQVKVSVNGIHFTLDLSGNQYKTYFAGTVNIAHAGYVKVDLQGITKTGIYFADVSDVLAGGPATISDVVFANDPQNFYWSRRGPSCHLNYTTPAGDKEYFYSELTVPAGEDKIGSYFMANGFGEGYMGIQVNSATERRVLFSVWDPASGQTTLVKKGNGVAAGRFGGEGTGGQSYMIFGWKTGVTYKFLTQGRPDGNGNTSYTSWFFAPENGNWQLMAEWSRPNTSKYLTGFHGFLENFLPGEGYQQRKAYWSNQWVRLTNGTWSEVTAFKFTVDATAKNKQRLDYAGGVENGKFFLQMGGFFAGNIVPNTVFEKIPSGLSPTVDLVGLP